MESETDLAPWEIEVETEDERQARYKREAEEMKLKWDARRMEEKQSAERRVAFAAKEKERASLYGPRDPIMEAYEDRMYEEARVIEVRRRQREVWERTKAHKLGRPLPPKGKPFVLLKPLPVEPAKPEEFDVSGRYIMEDDVEAQKYKAPESYVSPTGPAPPPRHRRGAPRAAWEDPPYGPPNPNMRASNFPKPGTPVPGYKPPEPIVFTKPKRKLEPDDDDEDDLDVDEEDDEEPEVAAEIAEEEEEAEDEDGRNLPTAAEANAMTVPKLKAALKEAGLPITGTKKVLLSRLLEAIEG